MPRPRPISLALISPMLLGFVLLTTALAAEPSPWLEIHSAHYTVITDAGDKKGREVASSFRERGYGLLNGIVVVCVVHSQRGEATRIISARKATKRERTLFHAYLKKACS